MQSSSSGPTDAFSDAFLSPIIVFKTSLLSFICFVHLFHPFFPLSKKESVMPCLCYFFEIRLVSSSMEEKNLTDEFWKRTRTQRRGRDGTRGRRRGDIGR